MRRLTNSLSPAARAASKPARSPRRMQLPRGPKSFCRRGYGASRWAVGKVCVVSRWHGMRYVRMSLSHRSAGKGVLHVLCPLSIPPRVSVAHLPCSGEVLFCLEGESVRQPTLPTCRQHRCYLYIVLFKKENYADVVLEGDNM